MRIWKRRKCLSILNGIWEMQKTFIRFLEEIAYYGLFQLCFKVEDLKEMELSGKDIVLCRLISL